MVAWRVSGMLLKMEVLVREIPDKSVQVHYVEAGEADRSNMFYRGRRPSSASSVSGVNSPICTAKRTTSLRVRRPSF